MSEYLCVLEIVSPEWSDLILTTYIPDCEADILVFDSFYIESYGGDSGDNFTQFHLVQYSGFASSIQANCNGS